MKLFNAAAMQAWDEYTIREEPILSINLMERAATACVEWIIKKYAPSATFQIFCGKGNNGGDGLAIARLLTEKGYQASVNILEFGFKGSPDFQENLARLHLYPSVSICFIQLEDHIKELKPTDVIIDALFGTGLNRSLEGLSASLVKKINSLSNTIISIDIPSGLFIDKSSKGNTVIEADYTLTFQNLKLAFLVAENESFIGEPVVLDIGLLKAYEQNSISEYELIDASIVQTFYKKRDSFSHKGSFGHALIIAGSQDKMGACILSTKACLKAGAGLVTAHIPAVGKKALNIVVPEVMLSIDTNETTFTSLPATLTKFNAIGIGPGIGTYNETVAAFTSLLKLVSPTTHLLLDADALNILSENKALLHQLKPNTILTPHPKEFDRLFGNCNNDFDRIELAKQNASEYKIIIVLKGHHTFIATPTEKHWFNSTGNAGMATGGSGDVLTGMITGLLAQQYEPLQACLLGVYLHGLAGDLALKVESMESLIASDIIKHIGVAYHSL